MTTSRNTNPTRGKPTRHSETASLSTPTFRDDTRAVTFSVEYVLTFAVALLLLAAVPTIIATSAESTEQSVQQAEFDRIAAEVAAAATAVDTRWAYARVTGEQTGVELSDTAIAVQPDTPERVGDVDYVIRATGDTLIVEPASPFDSDARATIPLDTEVDVTALGGTPGGSIVVEADPEDDQIVIKRDGETGETAVATKSGGEN